VAEGVTVRTGAAALGGKRVRREALLEWIHQRGEMRVEDLAVAVGASEVTVRRDLAELERQGLVDRCWGGARPHVALRYRGEHRERAARAAAAKRAVAAAAARLVTPNMVVALSGGTTLTLLARRLRGRPLNVVTNAVNVAAELHGSQATKVIVTGGALKSNAYELVGASADAIIRAYHVDLAFFSCSGVDEAGYGRRDHAEAAIVRAFRRAAARTVMLIDQGKLGRGYRARVAALGEVDQVIVDGPLPPEWRDRLAGGRSDVLEVAPCDTGAS